MQLAGVDMPFRFDSGGLSIKRSEIQAFSIKGAGQLPPELVGEANATISISMGRGKDGSLIVQSAEATLDKSNDPIVATARAKLTLSAIGLQFHDFVGRLGEYLFYALTGSAEFKPRAGEFTDGLLKNFGSLTITLDKAPLARDPAMLLRAIEFQVAVEPKKRINFFNLFTFELRGIGFHPASPAFGGKPAMSVSGQVNFVEAGDLVSPRNSTGLPGSRRRSRALDIAAGALRRADGRRAVRRRGVDRGHRDRGRRPVAEPVQARRCRPT